MCQLGSTGSVSSERQLVELVAIGFMLVKLKTEIRKRRLQKKKGPRERERERDWW